MGPIRGCAWSKMSGESARHWFETLCNIRPTSCAVQLDCTMRSQAPAMQKSDLNLGRHVSAYCPCGMIELAITCVTLHSSANLAASEPPCLLSLSLLVHAVRPRLMQSSKNNSAHMLNLHMTACAAM